MNRFARLPAFVLAGLAATVTLASAEPKLTNMIGAGFHDSSQPIGGRWWITDDYGVDLGIGFGAEKASTEIDTNGDFVEDTRVEDTLWHWSVEAGFPLTAWRWEGVRVIARPGLSYRSEDDFESFLNTGGRIKLNTFGATGELEVEVPIATNVTLSASHGVAFETHKLDVSGASSEWTVEALGLDFTQIGFHVYLWGPK